MSEKNKLLYTILGTVLFVAAWELLRVISQDPVIISSPKIGKELINIISNKDFYYHLFSTLKIVMLGILFAILCGVLVGVLVDLNEAVRNMIMPIVDMLRNIPSITLFPILLVMYGIEDGARIFIIFWTSVPSIILSTVFGLKNIEQSVIEAAQSSGANKLQIMEKIKLPLAFPEILNGIKIGIGSGFIAIVVAEMLGASKGLGFMVLWSTNTFKYAETYAYILIIAMIGALVNWIMGVLIKIYERNLL